MKSFCFSVLALCVLVGCDDGEGPEGESPDGALDAQTLDAQTLDAQTLDAQTLDAQTLDAQALDAQALDAQAGAEACPRTPEDQCAAVRWLTSRTAYPERVDHHTTLITHDGDQAWLEVFGGIRSDSQGGAEVVYSAVRRAPLSGRGEVGAFEDLAPLPFPMAFHAQIVVEDQVFLLGGITQDAQGVGANSQYLVGRLEGGQVAAWTPADLPREVRVHPTGEVLGRQLYLIGGTGAQGVVLDSVRVATLDGALGPFEAAAPLPAPRSHHASTVVNGHILIMGGFTTGQVAAPDVLRSVHDAAGVLTGWEVVGTLPATPWTSSAVVHRGWVWLVGGGEGEGQAGHFVATVRGAPLDAEGRPGPFETFDRPLPVARSHVHQTPVHAGFVYSVGGRVAAGNALASTNRVFVGELW